MGFLSHFPTSLIVIKRYFIPTFKTLSLGLWIGSGPEQALLLLHWPPSDPSQGRSTSSFTSTQHPPPPHALHSHRRRAESAERGSPRDQKASEASPLGPKPEPLARNTVEPQTGPSRQRPAFHLRRMSPRRITDQKTNPEVAATLLSSLGPSVLTKHQPSQLHVFCL